MKKIILPLAAILFMVSFGTLLISGSFTEDEKDRKEFRQAYKIFPVSVPEKLTFAGEAVPLKEFETRERLDKELLVNTYWQSQTILLLKRANRFFPVIEQILKKNGIPDDFKYVALAESGLMNVVSPSNAVGYWQFLEATGKMHNMEINDEVDERYNLETATEAACNYFKESNAIFNNWTLTAASYNMGAAGLKRQMVNQGITNYYDLYLNTETSRYIFRLLALKEIYEKPEAYGFYLKHKDLYHPVETREIFVDSSISNLPQFALDQGINYKLLKTLNPWLRKSTLTNKSGKKYKILIYTGEKEISETMNAVSDEEADMKGSTPELGEPLEKATHEPKPATVSPKTVHVVKKGESLDLISRKYKVSSAAIREANQLKSDNIKAGDKIRIPAAEKQN